MLPHSFHTRFTGLTVSWKIITDVSWKQVWQGYKANRKPGYKQLYNIVTIDEGSVICSNLTLDQLRSIFAQMDYPLYDEKSAKTTE